MKKKLSHKFGATRCEAHGIKFASKKERKRFLELLIFQKSDEVLFFLIQVPFHLPGGVKYICDFMVFWADGTITIEDVKGFKTDLYKTKKKLVESIYPVEITEIFY